MSNGNGFKVTYATLTAPSDEIHAAFDAAVGQVEAELGQSHPMLIGGESHTASRTFPDVNPANTRQVLGYFQEGDREDAQRAIAVARQTFPAWKRVPYTERSAILRRAANLISERRYVLAALMVMEMGKTRIEALGDVEESADLLRYYAHQMESQAGYIQDMKPLAPGERNRDVLKPYGVWAVISPFNFPMALAAGPVAAALVTGNTVVLKPSSDAPWIASKLVEILYEAGIPGGAVNLITGPGSAAGTSLTENEGVDGITFTGSYAVGYERVYRRFSRRWPKPVIVEMGGKNPAIVMPSADLGKAATGVMRSAFGMGGQKCSACSRVYVHKAVRDDFLGLLVEKTKALVIGNPLHRDVFLGPVVNEAAYRTYQEAVQHARQNGHILYGGQVLTRDTFAYGWYVQPTIVTGLPQGHRLVQEELFVPLLVVLDVDSMGDALAKANDTVYGLTAGLYSEEPTEIEMFLDSIEAGVTYVNRASGATTGAWPGCQPFGGWKASGSSGRAIGGPYSLLNYMREQSQTIVV